MPQAKRKAAKKAAAKKKPAAKRPPEPEIQVNRDMTETEQQDPALFQGTPNELDENGETQADRDAAGDAWRDKTRSSGASDADDYEQVHEPLEHADFDHHAAEERRQAELDAERDRHNQLTAGSATD